MPEYNITESVLTSLTAQEPWPENVKLFQPYEVEQILLPDNASCLAVQAFLKMCNLPFEVEMRWNAEFMSPSGRVPFIKCGAFVVSELEPIVQFAANKGVTLCSRLSTEEKAEMRAYMSLITNVLVNAELYISWLDNDTFNAVTKVRNSSVYPWPLGWLQTRSKRNAVAKRLKALHWHDKTLDQVLADVEQCCNSLSQRLGDRDYFFGTTPTPLDALVYGHIRALLSATGPKVALLIKPITSPLLKHVVRVAGATRMKLTAQEEYLITQAFQVTKRRLSSPDRSISDRSTRARKSRLCCKNSSKDDNIYGKDVFGFKPFASKQIIIMISKEGLLTCAYEYPYKHPNFTLRNEETYDLVTEILEDVIDKVEELAFHEFTKKIDKERNDFEIVYPSDFTNVVIKIDDYLGTIDETDMSMSRIDEQSNGVASERNLEVKTSESPRKFESDFTDSSNIIKESYLTVCSSGDKINKMSDKTELPKTPLSTGSKSTLKLSPNDEISVESLLKYLRERNSSFTNLLQVADVDFD